jgi:hypothetical protein
MEVLQLLCSHPCWMIGGLQLTNFKVKVILQLMVSWPVCLGVKPPSGAQDQLFVLSRQFRAVDVEHPICEGDGSFIYNCYRSLPAQSFLDPSPTGLRTIFFCLRFEISPTWRVRSLYLYPSGIEWPNYNPRHWVPFLLPLVTLRAVMEVFKPASTWSAILTNLLYPVMWLQVRSLREHCFQHLFFFFLCVHMRCHGHVFIEPLPCSRWFFSHHFTVLSTEKFQEACPGKPPKCGINE